MLAGRLTIVQRNSTSNPLGPVVSTILGSPLPPMAAAIGTAFHDAQLFSPGFLVMLNLSACTDAKSVAVSKTFIRPIVRAIRTAHVAIPNPRRVRCGHWIRG